MKKIGFIDLFLDEWHANNYPKMFRKTPLGSEFEFCYAWEEMTPDGKKPLQTWCKEQQMIPARSIEEVIEKSDCLCVLAPDNPEVHERLADLPLRSGKPVFIDKPFAETRAAAERMFALAERYNTPLMSSSALRFGDEIMKGALREKKIDLMCTTGGGRSFKEYGVHQLEMLVSVMGTAVKDVKLSGDPEKFALSLEYEDGRIGQLLYARSFNFTVSAAGKEGSVYVSNISNMFENLLAEILNFFTTGKSVIPPEETIAIAGLLEQGAALLKNKG